MWAAIMDICPVYLKLQDRIPGAIATDVAEGPLSRARAHIEQYGLGSYIEPDAVTDWLISDMEREILWLSREWEDL